MSIENALIAQSQPHLVRTKLASLMREEMGKGCKPQIASRPVCLEPLYLPISQINQLPLKDLQDDFVFEPSPSLGDLRRSRVWLSPEEYARLRLIVLVRFEQAWTKGSASE